MKRNWKFKPKARLRVGKVMPLAAKGAARYKAAMADKRARK
jgi:hypothetical protein